MQLSDPLSSLLHSKTDYLIHFPQTKEDPSYIIDLKTHLEQNNSYRADRREYGKLHPKWSIFRRQDEYFKQFVEEFHVELEKFAGYYPGLPALDLSLKFCGAWKVYSELVGVELVERGIRRLQNDS